MNLPSEADRSMNEIIRHLNAMDRTDRMIVLNALVWMLVDKTIGTKHDKIGILETTKFKIMGVI